MSEATSPLVRHVLGTVGVVLVVGTALAFAMRGPGDAWAIGLSGLVAIVVQLAAFAVGRTVGQGNITARMGVGALFRFFSLVVYALVVGLVLKLPIFAALLSLFLFFFLSTLIEPFLIRS